MNPYESTPTAIPAESFGKGTRIVQVTAGDSASFALTQKGFVYGWGTFVVSNFPSFQYQKIKLIISIEQRGKKWLLLGSKTESSHRKTEHTNAHPRS